MSKSAFDICVLNGLGGDPSVKITVTRSHLPMLFDLGDIKNLTHKDLVKIRHIFISHCHMDHFMDFDRIIRINVPLRRKLHLYGPKGLIDQISFRLRSYTWNLIDDDQLPIYATEIDTKKSSMRSAVISKKTEFVPENIREKDIIDWTILELDDGSKVKAVCLDHKGIDSIAYQIQSPVRYKIDMDRVKDLNLKAGPWLRQLQIHAQRREFDQIIDTNKKPYQVADLIKQVATEIPSQGVAYLTDIGFSKNNLDKITTAFSPNGTVICESSFAVKDKDRATDKAHLTSYQAAMIARNLKASSFQVFHISNLYAGKEEEVAKEAYQALQTLMPISQNEINLLVKEELQI